MSSFIGVDQSYSNTAVIEIDSYSGVFKSGSVFKFEVKPNFEHYSNIYNWFTLVFGREEPLAFAVEGYAFAAKGNTLTKLVELGSLMIFAASQSLRGRPLYIIAPQNLKAFVGVRKKEEMRLGVYKMWGYEAKTNDEIDAYALARYAEAIYKYDEGFVQTLKAFQVKALNSWLKNKNGIYVGGVNERTD